MRESLMKNLHVARVAAHAALVVFFTFGFAATGSANSDGIIGVSGKNSGFFCRNCHAGGTVPTVAFEGPTSMELGSTAIFSFMVSSHSDNQIAAGFNVATDSGALGVVEGQGTRLQLNEVTHNSPKPNDANGQVIFEFTWEAPDSEGTYTLFGAGCSVNGNSQQNGDAAARTTHEIIVGAAVSTPTPTAPPPTETPTATPRETDTPSEIGPCVGDCGGDEQVTVDELVTGVNVALGVTPLSACPDFDTSGDGAVTVDELLRAVNSALNGCLG
jgi:hypothetical protein